MFGMTKTDGSSDARSGNTSTMKIVLLINRLIRFMRRIIAR